MIHFGIYLLKMCHQSIKKAFCSFWDSFIKMNHNQSMMALTYFGKNLFISIHMSCTRWHLLAGWPVKLSMTLLKQRPRNHILHMFWFYFQVSVLFKYLCQLCRGNKSVSISFLTRLKYFHCLSQSGRYNQRDITRKIQPTLYNQCSTVLLMKIWVKNHITVGFSAFLWSVGVW